MLQGFWKSCPTRFETCHELKGTALDRFLLQRHGRTWDSVPLPGLKASDLSSASIAKLREQAAASGRLSPTDLVSSDAGMLEKLKLTEGDYLKRAAVLLFHKTPDRFITGAFVKIGFFVSESELGYHDEIHGPLFTQANTVIDLLQRIGSQGLRCSRADPDSRVRGQDENLEPGYSAGRLES